MKNEKIKIKMCLILTLIFFSSIITAQRESVNYDESKVNTYILPSILKSHGGININTIADWENYRRPELLNDFTQFVYGRIPGEIDSIKVIVEEDENLVLNGIAKRKQVTLVLMKDNKSIDVNLLIYLPKSNNKVAVFLGYNFYGNQSISDDKDVFLTKSWIPIRPKLGIHTNIAGENTRGLMKSRWPLEKVIKSGYGLITLSYGDIDPDKNDLTDGVHQLFYTNKKDTVRDDEWRSIAAWSWGLSRVLDYLETVEEIDSRKVIVFGHSRLGKVALWTVASDSRFAASISNNSGCMGAALSRRDFGETVEIINQTFPHWFNGNFKKYSKNESILPIDQHMLISLIAPRPVYIASATQDLWADPKGEFLSAKEASVIYNLHDIQGLISVEMPDADSPIIGTVSYHLRTGRHDITSYDWEQYIKFAKYNGF